MIRWWLLATLALFPAGVAAGDDAVPPGYADLGHRLQAAGNEMRTTLEDALPDGVRVVDVEAGYLAGQGLLIIADLASPWYRLDGSEVELAPELSSLEQIPDMVHEILTEMNLGLSRGEIAELQALRRIRDGQRAQRSEQRALRARLREFGRERLRAPPDAAETLSREIEALEAELAAAEARERSLTAEAEALRAGIDDPPSATPGTVDQRALDRAVAGMVCQDAAGFDMRTGESRVNVVVRRADSARYYVFSLARVRDCAAGALDAASLLEESLRYGG